MKNYITSLLVLLLFAGCKKDLRIKTYQLKEYNNSGMSGTVSFVETDEKDVTIVRLEASNVPTNIVYPCHLHTGTLNNLINTQLNFTNLQTTTGMILREEPWSMSYDQAIVSNTCFNLHMPNYTANDTTGYYLAANTGINAQ